MDSRLRQLQRESRNGDPAAIAQYWAALVRANLIPKEYIWALSRVGNPAAVSLHPTVPKNESLKTQVFRFLDHPTVPTEDIYDFSLLTIDFLMKEWILSIRAEDASSPICYLENDAQCRRIIPYLQSLSPGIKYEDDVVADLQEHVVELIADMERVFVNLPGLRSCNGSVELPLFKICCKYLAESGVDLLPFLEDHVPLYVNQYGSQIIELYSGIEICDINSKIFRSKWNKFLKLQVISPIRMYEPWFTELTSEGDRVLREPGVDRIILIDAVKKRFAQLINHFFNERINNLAF